MQSLYNSVCACWHTHINSSVSAPLNATKIAIMKGIHWWMPMVGPEFLFLIYKCWKKVFFNANWLHKAGTILASFVGSGPTFSTSRCVAPLYEAVLRESLCCVGSGMGSSARCYYRKGNICDQFFTQFNDTEWVHNRQPERSRVTS